jgi:phage baseplate assembly protein W|tara:strand:+ start:2386 stop:2766 length:381 start_codon:yes stop_codon:yes gene_type:complete
MSRFSDIDLNFTKNPITNDVNILRDSEAVRRSVRNIVLYNFLEKPFSPTFGGNVRGKLFENINSITALRIKGEIEKAIIDNEPRASLRGVKVSPDLDRNAFDVTIVFNVNNNPAPVKVEISLERIR